MPTALLRIGTRGSPLARAQAEEVARRLRAAHGDDLAIEIVPLQTSGDAIGEQPLSEFGGKGLFTKEIDEALLAGRIDLSVHSAKDLATALPEGIAIAAVLPREDVRDAFLSPRSASFEALPRGAVFGTSSLRRKAFALRLRPDLQVIPFRGNVGTRLRKLDDGIAAATMLALAGLRRLGLAHHATALVDPEAFVPAVGQGAIVIEALAGDSRVHALLQPLNDPATAICLAAERAFLAVLDGSCRTPIGGWARLAGGRVDFRAAIVAQDGSAAHLTSRTGPVADATALGRDAGSELKRRGGPDFFRAA